MSPSATRVKTRYSIQLGYFVAPILTEASLAEAVQRVLEVRSAVHAPLLLEPPPATFRMGPMSMFEWLGKLAEQTDCGLLLDSGHILSHQLVEGQRGLDLLPLDRVVEVHIAGGILSQRHPRRYLWTPTICPFNRKPGKSSMTSSRSAQT